MASRQEQASYHAGETKARAEASLSRTPALTPFIPCMVLLTHTLTEFICCIAFGLQEKTGQVMGAAQERGREAKQKAYDAADRAMGRGHDAKEATKDRAWQAKDAASDAAGRDADRGRGAAEATKEKAYEAGDGAREGARQTGGYVAQTAEAARQKAAGAAQYAKETVVAGKDKTGAILQQAGEKAMNTAVAEKDTVVSTAVGAKDAVMNSLGMAGENNDGTTTNNAGAKDTSKYKPGTGTG